MKERALTISAAWLVLAIAFVPSLVWGSEKDDDGEKKEEVATTANGAKSPETSPLVETKEKEKKKSVRSETLLNDKPVVPGKAPFTAGERLDFEVTWFNVKGGIATLEVVGFDEFEGETALHLRTTAISSKAFSVFMKVEDVGDSWIHPTGLHSLGYVTNQNEGGRYEFQKVILDNEDGTAHSHRMIRKQDDRVKRKEQKLHMEKTYVQDALSMLYYFRAFDLKKGDRLKTHVHTSRKIWELTVDVLGKETIKTPVGKFDCLKVRPSVKHKGKPQNKGTMTMWITDDDRKIPVKITSDVKIGKINAILIDYEEPDEF